MIWAGNDILVTIFTSYIQYMLSEAVWTLLVWVLVC